MKHDYKNIKYTTYDNKNKMHDTKSKTKLTLRTQSITQMLQAKYDTHIKKHDTKKYNERPLKKTCHQGSTA